MPYFKDKTGGLHFLDDAAFAHLLPEGCIEITDSEASELQKPTASQEKITKWDAIKAKRDAIKAGGVKVGTKWYHSDETSRTQYIGLLRMADAAVAAGGTGSTTLQYGGQDIQWKTMDGTFIKMTVQRANDVFNAVSGLDFAAFGAAEAHKAAMEASADPASYDFAAGWPATFGG